MNEYGLKEAIDEHMPFIDGLLQQSKIPIFNRFMHAAKIFVDVAVIDSNFESQEEFLKSKAFFEGIIPLVNDWYWERYGELSKSPTDKCYSGIITPYGQPVLVKIPATTSKVEVPNETVWFSLPDCLQKTESIGDMIQTQIGLNKLPKEEMDKLSSEFSEVVSLTRSINLNMMTTTGLDQETSNLLQGVWSHFEKSILDILSFKNQQASIGCWELHLAIEKALKVYLKQVSGNRMFGHDLKALSSELNKYDHDLDLSIVRSLPSDKEAIKLRYSELITSVNDVVDYYKKALILVSVITSRYSRQYCFNNASFLIKIAPWAR